MYPRESLVQDIKKMDTIFKEYHQNASDGLLRTTNVIGGLVELFSNEFPQYDSKFLKKFALCRTMRRMKWVQQRIVAHQEETLRSKKKKLDYHFNQDSTPSTSKIPITKFAPKKPKTKTLKTVKNPNSKTKSKLPSQKQNTKSQNPPTKNQKPKSQKPPPKKQKTKSQKPPPKTQKTKTQKPPPKNQKTKNQKHAKPSNPFLEAVNALGSID